MLLRSSLIQPKRILHHRVTRQPPRIPARRQILIHRIERHLQPPQSERSMRPRIQPNVHQLVVAQRNHPVLAEPSRSLRIPRPSAHRHSMCCQPGSSRHLPPTDETAAMDRPSLPSPPRQIHQPADPRSPAPKAHESCPQHSALPCNAAAPPSAQPRPPLPPRYTRAEP